MPTYDLPKRHFNDANVVFTTCNDRQYWSTAKKGRFCDQREHRATLRPIGRRRSDIFNKSWVFCAICRFGKLWFGKLSSANYLSANCESANGPLAKRYPPLNYSDEQKWIPVFSNSNYYCWFKIGTAYFLIRKIKINKPITMPYLLFMTRQLWLVIRSNPNFLAVFKVVQNILFRQKLAKLKNKFFRFIRGK